MSVLQNSLAGNFDPLLEEGLALAGKLSLLEKEIQQGLLSMDFQSLASAVESGAGILRRGARFLEQKKKLAGEKTLREMIELQPESVKRSAQLGACGLLIDKLAVIKAGEEVNRCLVGAGTQIASRLQNIISACRTTYNFRGELSNSFAGARHGLDQNC